MSNFETDYGDLVYEILATGRLRETRNGATMGLFGKQLTVDMSDSKIFPLLVGRKMYPKGVLGELAALLRGPKHVKDFEKFGCNYWKQWADKDGNLNLDYGNAWFDLNGVNQFATLIDTLRNNPTDRRLIITSWRPDRLDQLSLPCCHHTYQWYVRDGKYLDMLWMQRSVDVMVGLPSDIVLAAMLNILIANETDYKPGKLTFSLGDTHIYIEHVIAASKYLDELKKATPIHPAYRLHAPVNMPSQSFEPHMLELRGYCPASPISFELKA